MVATLAFGAVPAHAVMDGAGHDFFPVAAIFTASATITYANANRGQRPIIVDELLVFRISFKLCQDWQE